MASESDKKNTISSIKQERELRGWTQRKLASLVGTTQVNVSRWEKNVTTPGPYYRQRLAELFGKSIQELGFVSVGGEELMRNSPKPQESSSTQSSLPLPIWNIFHRRNPYFTGRRDILSQLHTALTNNKTAALTQAQAISGLGGVGKTQIASEYTYRYRDAYQAIFWVNASSYDACSSDFVAIAVLLKLPEQHEEDQDIVIRAVKRWLTLHSDWLLILDNVDDLEMIANFLPQQSTGSILITTRLQALGTIAQSIEVEKMGMKEGITFLLRRTKMLPPGASADLLPEEYQKQAAEIVSRLDGLPLALDQAGAYIEETRCSMVQYLDLYRVHRKELLSRRGSLSIDHPEPVATTLSLSFRHVERESIAAAELLRLFAFLNPEAIPEELITLGSAELGPALAEVANNTFQINEALELLLRYSFVKRSPEARTLDVHRLVQAVLRDNMDWKTQAMWAERTIRALNCTFPNVEMQTWESGQRCIPHIQRCIVYLDEYSLVFLDAAQLFSEAASYLIVHASYKQAEDMLLKALELRQRLLESNHPDIANTLNGLGVLYYNQGRYQAAESLLQNVLKLRQQMPRREHLDEAQTFQSLAGLYRAQGFYAKAEPFYLQALQIREAILGNDHPLVALSYYGLAKLYRSRGRYDHAENYCRKALRIQEQSLGEEHPMIASTLHVLARIHQGQNQLQRAKTVIMRALWIREKTSGENHPHAAAIINSLIEILHAEGKYQEAEPLISKTLRIHEQSLGKDHPYIAYSLNNLADSYYLRGLYDRAIIYYTKALLIREKSLGLRHPHTAMAYFNLAKLYVAQILDEEAEPFFCKALAIWENTLGSDHPAVIALLEYYSASLKRLGRDGEALKLEMRIKQIIRDHSG